MEIGKEFLKQIEVERAVRGAKNETKANEDDKCLYKKLKAVFLDLDVDRNDRHVQYETLPYWLAEFIALLWISPRDGVPSSCRVLPPAGPLFPLHMQLHGHHILEH